MNEVTDHATRIAVCAALALFWLLVNIKAGQSTVKRLSFWAILVFAGLASYLTIDWMVLG